MPIQVSEPAGKGIQPNFLISLTSSGLEALKQWCQVVPGSWPCHLGLHKCRQASPLEFQVPQSGQFDFSTGREDAQYRGSSQQRVLGQS